LPGVLFFGRPALLGHRFVPCLSPIGRLLSRVPIRRSLMPGSLAKSRGAAAERRAARHLWLRGWRICARNWIGGGGELDLVVSRWRTLVIVEVRRRPTLAAAFASIDRDKLNRTIAAAAALVRAYGLERYRVSFDVIAIADDGALEWRRDLLRIGAPGF
jgi:putative endonuclease